jgi:hypothetical protein
MQWGSGGCSKGVAAYGTNFLGAPKLLFLVYIYVKKYIIYIPIFLGAPMGSFFIGHF